VTVLADVVGFEGVTLSAGLERAADRAVRLSKAGAEGASDETLIFLLDPSSDTLRTMLDDSACSLENGGVDFKSASIVEYGACASMTRLE